MGLLGSVCGLLNLFYNIYKDLADEKDDVRSNSRNRSFRLCHNIHYKYDNADCKLACWRFHINLYVLQDLLSDKARGLGAEVILDSYL